MKNRSQPPQARQPAPQDARVFYRRRLPHWQPDGAILFITYRLLGSLPATAICRLAEERRLLEREPVARGEDPRDRAFRRRQRLFELADRELDASGRIQGMPHWLSDARVAALVQGSIQHWDDKRYLLHRYVVMPNHVHILVEPSAKSQAGQPAPQAPACEVRWSLAEIMQGLKGYTAREANRLLGRSATFWQEESWDRWVRDADDFDRIVAYIDQNPVAAGLCATPEQWPWGSAGARAVPAASPGAQAV